MDKIIVQVIERQTLAKNIISLKLQPIHDQLPKWSAGAHVDIFLPDGQARQYSIINSYSDENCLLLGILVDENGRGGSIWIEQNANVGSELTVGKPRNHFEYLSANANHQVFIAGGIGITPLLPMIRQAEADNSDWELHYIGRSLENMAYVEDLKSYGNKVTFYPRDTTERPDFTQILDLHKSLTIYCCGPELLMDKVEELGHQFANITVISERFSAKPLTDDSGFDEFEVVFSYSGITAKVNREQSILEVAEAAGIYVSHSCSEGICGSCETPIISGQVIHRDSVLSEAERIASKTMMICISRANCSRLALDL